MEEMTMDKAKELLSRGVSEAEQLISDPSKVEGVLVQLEEKLKEVPAIGESLSDIPLMISMVKGYITGAYKEVSPKVIVTILGAFIYLVKKKDLIPDRIPVIGIVDDIAVLTMALKFTEPELNAYKAWRDGAGIAREAEAPGMFPVAEVPAETETAAEPAAPVREKIEIEDYAGEILKALPAGILLTTKSADKVNSMVIGWGTFGVNWSRPVFAAYVREGRFTREMLDMNPEFTVNIPVGEFDKKILAVCGSKSGRDVDKIAEAGLTTVEGNTVSVPAIREFPLTLECKVVYRQKQELTDLPVDILQKFYPQNVESAPGANRDAHITYYGEITDAYILK